MHCCPGQAAQRQEISRPWQLPFKASVAEQAQGDEWWAQAPPSQRSKQPDRQYQPRYQPNRAWKETDKCGDRHGHEENDAIEQKRTAQSDRYRKLHRSCPGPISLDALEHQRPVGSAKAEIVLQCDINLHRPRLVGAVVQVTFRILVEDVDGRRRNLVMDGQYCKQ